MASNVKLLEYCIKTSRESVEIKVYYDDEGVRHVGFLVFIDGKCSFSLDYGPVHSNKVLVGCKAEVAVNFIDYPRKNIKTKGQQWKFTDDTYYWREQALEKIRELLVPSAETYRVLSTNCANDVANKINKNDKGGHDMLKEAQTAQTGLTVGSFLGLGAVAAAGFGLAYGLYRVFTGSNGADEDDTQNESNQENSSSEELVESILNVDSRHSWLLHDAHES